MGERPFVCSYETEDFKKYVTNQRLYNSKINDYYEYQSRSDSDFVSDIQKAKKWYSEVLGMKVIKEYPKFRCILMKLGNVEFDIGTPTPEWGEGWNIVKVGGRTAIFFETQNIKQTVKELKQKGVKFVEEISKRPWGEYKAVFSDPDGNEFNLIQPD